jgi:hypothetical protein
MPRREGPGRAASMFNATLHAPGKTNTPATCSPCVSTPPHTPSVPPDKRPAEHSPQEDVDQLPPAVDQQQQQHKGGVFDRHSHCVRGTAGPN